MWPRPEVQAKIRLTRPEAHRNFYFRDGDDAHTFAAGQRAMRQWRGHSEDAVLAERVHGNLKPVASIVLNNDPFNDPRYQRRLLRALVSLGASFAVGQNEWGVHVLVFTCQPDITLKDLLAQRDHAEQALVSRNRLRDKRSVKF